MIERKESPTGIYQRVWCRASDPEEMHQLMLVSVEARKLSRRLKEIGQFAKRVLVEWHVEIVDRCPVGYEKDQNHNYKSTGAGFARIPGELPHAIRSASRFKRMTDKEAQDTYTAMVECAANLLLDLFLCQQSDTAEEDRANLLIDVGQGYEQLRVRQSEHFARTGRKVHPDPARTEDVRKIIADRDRLFLAEAGRQRKLGITNSSAIARSIFDNPKLNDPVLWKATDRLSVETIRKIICKKK